MPGKKLQFLDPPWVQSSGLKGTRAALISVVRLSFLGLLDFGLSSMIGCSLVE